MENTVAELGRHTARRASEDQALSSVAKGTKGRKRRGRHVGIVEALAKLDPKALLDERVLANILDRHPRAIKRAIEKGELPASVKLRGARVWTAGCILRHIEGRLRCAQREVDLARASDHRSNDTALLSRAAEQHRPRVTARSARQVPEETTAAPPRGVARESAARRQTALIAREMPRAFQVEMEFSPAMGRRG